MLLDFVLVALGSLAGGLVRFSIIIHSKLSKKPWNTLVINVIGSFFMSIIVALYQANKINWLSFCAIAYGFLG